MNLKESDSKVTIRTRSPRYKPFPRQRPPNRLQPLPRITAADTNDNKRRRGRMNELPSVSQEYIKPKVVRFYKNGDRNFRGSHVTVTPRRFRNFDNLLNELTRITNLAQGARYIFTPVSGSRVETLDQLSDGQSYVCGSHPKLKKINYNHAPDGSSHKKKPSNKNFVPVPPASKLNVEKSRYTTASSSSIKPKVVRIIRNGVGVNKQTVKLLLNKRTAQSFEQVLDDITSIVGVQGGFVKKLYDRNGRLVHNLSGLFGSEDVFIAVGGEKFKVSDIPKILQESGLENGQIGTPEKKTKDSLVPSPPKSIPNKNRNKHLIKNSPYSKKKPFTTHSKLPSISKRKDPEGESQGSPTPEHHVTMDEKDVANVDDSRKISIDSERHSSNNSIRSSHDSENSSPRDKKNSVTESDSKIDSPRAASVMSNKIDNNVHIDLSDMESSDDDDDDDDIDSPKSKESSIVMTKDSPHKETLLSGDSDSEQEKNEETENVSLQNDIVGLLDLDAKAKNEPKQEIYNERLTKAFNDKSEIDQYYEIGKKLGDGNFAVVKKVTDKKNNMEFAMKVIDASKMEGKLSMLQNEIKIQRDCNHPNIARLYHDYHSPTEIFLIMELISGGDFFDLVSSNVSFEEPEASSYMRDLCSGLDYLHQRGIVHRDIKPENLMVYENDGKISLKLADFGLAMKVTSPIFTICGTPTYVAPEILSEEGYGLEVDVWAAGVILYIMLCGFPPFRSPNRKQTELFDLIEKCDYEFLEPYWEDVSEDAKDLISKILVADRSTRLTAKQVFDHPWLCHYGLDRNNTILNLSTRRSSNRFRTAARSIQSIERMKMLLRLEREKCMSNITVHHEKDEEKEEEKQKQQEETIQNDSTEEQNTDEQEIDSDSILNDFISKDDAVENHEENKPTSDDDSASQEIDDPSHDVAGDVNAPHADQGGVENTEGTTDDDVKDGDKIPYQLSDGEDSADPVSKDGEEDSAYKSKNIEEATNEVSKNAGEEEDKDLDDDTNADTKIGEDANETTDVSEDDQESSKDEQHSTDQQPDDVYDKVSDCGEIEDENPSEEKENEPKDGVNDKDKEDSQSNSSETIEKEDENETTSPEVKDGNDEPKDIVNEEKEDDDIPNTNEEEDDVPSDNEIEDGVQTNNTKDIKDDNNNNDTDRTKPGHPDPNSLISDNASNPLSMKTAELKQHTDSGVESAD